MFRRLSIAIVVLLFNCLVVMAIDVPKLQDRVNDLAGVLTPDQIAGLDSKLQSFENTDSTQVAVLIIPSLEGDSLEDYSIRVAEAWKIGKRGRDNGAILLVSIKDRAVRIEVGYGLEGKLTDLRSGQIIRNEIIPRFRQGDYYAGIDAGITAIIETIRGMYQGSPGTEYHYSSRRSSGLHLNLNLLIVLLFPLFWILSATGKWGGGILGTGAGMLLPYTLISHSLIVLLIGGAVGAVLGALVGAMVRSGSKSGGGPGGFGGPFFWGGGGGGFSGGGFGGGGGFSGGGGGFGGGGSSGRW
jgi:uncharacterized protein